METFETTFTKDYFVSGRARYFPVAVFVTAAVTLVTIQILCHAIPHHVPDSLFFAPFSVAAVGVPERYVYGVGMTLTAIFFLFTLYYVYRAYAQRLEHKYSCVFKLCVPLIVIAVTGLIVQAWVHLQTNILSDDTYASGRYNWESIVHTVAAGVFFGLSTVFVVIVCVLVYRSADAPLGRIVTSGSRIGKYVAAGLLLASVVAGFLMHPSIGIYSRRESSLFFNLGGAFQWICVFSLLAFIATFTFDLGRHDDEMDGAYERVEKAPNRRDGTTARVVTVGREGALPAPPPHDPTTSDEEAALGEEDRLVAKYR